MLQGRTFILELEASGPNSATVKTIYPEDLDQGRIFLLNLEQTDLGLDKDGYPLLLPVSINSGYVSLAIGPQDFIAGTIRSGTFAPR